MYKENRLENISEFINDIMLNDDSEKTKNTGQVSILPRNLKKVISILEKKNILKPKMIGIDLGSGYGNSTLFFCLAGYKMDAYEFNLDAYKVALNKMSNFKKKQNCNFVNDSYYPKDYFINENKYKELENRLSERYGKHLYKNEGKIKKETFKKYDFFFAYLWADQIPSVLDLFINYSNKNSFIICLSQINKTLFDKIINKYFFEDKKRILFF